MPGSNAIKNKPAVIPSISELQKNNPALFKSFYSSPVAKALLLAKTMKYFEVNKQFLNLLESTRKQVIGKSPDELGLWVNPKERKKILKEFDENSKRSFNFDIKSLKGKVRNVIVSFEIIQINGIDFLLGYLLDNTDKKDFENMLKQNEEQYKLLFYRNPLPMCLFDFKTQKFIGVNDALIKHYGYTKVEFLKMKITDIFPREELPKYSKFRKTIISKKEQFKAGNSGIWKHKKKNGEIIDVEVTRSHVKYDGKNAILILANDVTSILEAQRKLKRKNEEVNLLYNSAKEISSTINSEEIYNKIHKVISKLVPCNGMIISSYDRERKLIKCSAAWVKNKKLDVTKIPVLKLDSGGKGLQSMVIKSRKSMIVDDYDKYSKQNKSVIYIYKDNSIRKRLKKSDKINRSALIIPLQLHKKVIGVIQVLSYAKNAYNDEHLKLMETFGAELSSITANARLFEQAQNEIEEKQKAREELALRNKEVTLLYRAGRELLSTLDLKEIYEIFYRKTIEVIPCDSMIISEYHKKSDKIYCKAAWVENTKHNPSDFPPLNVGPNYKGTQSEAIVTGNSVIINNFYELIKDRKDKFIIDDEGNVMNSLESEIQMDHEAPVTRSALFIPMKLGKNVIGVISVFSFKENAYTEYDLKILESISVNLSVAAANAELYNRAQIEISERISKEDELIQIRKNMEEAQRISHLGSWVLDKSTNHITNSKEVYKILGLNPRKGEIDFDEAMGYIFEEDKVRTIEVIKNAMLKNVSYVNEDRIIRPNGEIRYVKVMGEPVYDKNGALKGMQGTIQDITDVKRINEEIVRSLGEKEVMIKEIHHRVKNNLQIVSSLLRLQADKIKDKTVVAYFNQSEQRIKSMALIHQQLYQTKDLSRINFREYLSELCSYLLFANDSTPGRINIKIDAQELYLGIDTALPCGLIINELFTNAIKYAFPDDRNGIILIKLCKDTDDKYHLMIKDNGIGATNLDFKKTASLGMELVNTLIDQLEGDISINIDNGTEINLSFKEPVYSKRI